MPDEQDVQNMASSFDSYIEYLERQVGYMAAHPAVVPAEKVGEDGWLDLDKDYRRMPPARLVRSVYGHDGKSEVTEESYGAEIEIKERDGNRIRLARKPESGNILVKQYTWGFEEQTRSLRHTRDNIDELAGAPLMKLFCSMDGKAQSRDSGRGIIWKARRKAEKVTKWHILRDGREGEEKQREFVTKALKTPDFALLEGPPGSGKTTVLCELVIQLIQRGKRVIFCAPTHYAVDNLVEKLTVLRPDIVPVRHGHASNITNAQSAKYHADGLGRLLDKIKGSEKLPDDPLVSELKKRVAKLRNAGDSVQLGAVADPIHCGTITGIKVGLEHSGIPEDFDVMIVDEASKVKFIEFVIPAQMASRWIISGDTRQLSPYTDENSLIPNLNATIPDDTVKDICVDVFKATGKGKFHTILVISEGPSGQDALYEAQCKELGVSFHNLHGQEGAWLPRMGPCVILCDPGVALLFLQSLKKGDEKSMDKTRTKLKIRGYNLVKERDGEWWECDVTSSRNEREESWAGIFHWRLSMDFASRDIGEWSASSMLLPSNALVKLHGLEGGAMCRALDQFNNVEMNSILSLFQHGYLADSAAASYDCVLERGFRQDDLEDRAVLLTHQYRMHPDIAGFSHANIYGKKALFTPDSVEEGREWDYNDDEGKPAYPKRLFWKPVLRRGTGPNEDEAEALIKELERFVRWAAIHPKEGGLWEVGVISFYRDQQNLLKKRIRQILAYLAGKEPFASHGGGVKSAGAANLDAPKEWRAIDDARGTTDVAEPPLASNEDTQEAVLRGMKDGKEFGVSVKWGTVDAFQGKEVDISFLSFSNHYPTMFLNNAFRINVAVTRARYQCVMFGDLRLSNRGEILRQLFDYSNYVPEWLKKRRAERFKARAQDSGGEWKSHR